MSVTHKKSRISLQLDKLRAQSRGKEPAVKVGILQEGYKQPKEEEGGKKSNEVTLGDVAAMNEFGTESIPPRPFIKGSFDANKDEWRKLTRKLAHELMHGKKSFDNVLNTLGMKIQADTKSYMHDLKDPANAEITKKKKKFDNPLIETGQLVNSIHYEITDRKKERKT